MVASQIIIHTCDRDPHGPLAQVDSRRRREEPKSRDEEPEEIWKKKGEKDISLCGQGDYLQHELNWFRSFSFPR